MVLSVLVIFIYPYRRVTKLIDKSNVYAQSYTKSHQHIKLILMGISVFKDNIGLYITINTQSQ